MATTRLPRVGEAAIRDIIARYGLHHRLALPVPIRQIARNEGWHITYRERLFPLYAFAVIEGPVRLMVVNSDVSDAHQRMAIAHEMGHVLNGDPAVYPFLCAASGPLAPWTSRRMEHQADLAAALLLIPEWALYDAGSVDEIAAACEVPESLVRVRIAAWQRSGQL